MVDALTNVGPSAQMQAAKGMNRLFLGWLTDGQNDLLSAM